MTDPQSQPAPGYGYETPPKRRGGKIVVIVLAVLVVLAAACGIGAYLLARNMNSTAAKAKEGDCLAGDTITGTQKTTTPLKIVNCDAADARYKVIARIPDKTSGEAVVDLCVPYAPKGADVIYWEPTSRGASKGTVLCLGAAKP